tara:strand:- start:2980 stop:3435 length:456 start_codon:yes stop_codon:yes gene_type:complete
MKLFSTIINRLVTLSACFLIIGLLGCDLKKNITEDQVKFSLDGFFAALDVDHYDCDKLGEWVTEDFMLYEMEKPFSRNQFCDFVDDALADMTSTDRNSAHVYYRNQGRFVSMGEDGQEMVMNMEWLESAYMVRQKDGALKIKFLSSDDINN